MKTIYLALMIYLTSFALAEEADNDEYEDDEEEGEQGNEITMDMFPPKEITEEEHESQHIPERYKCDACRAVAYELGEAFGKAHRLNPKATKLPESQVLDLVEEVCSSGFPEYGLKTVDGIKELSGPGIRNPTGGIAITQLGGAWPKRLSDMCFYYVGEIEEWTIYVNWKRKPELFQHYLCRRSGIQGACIRDRDEL